MILHNQRSLASIAKASRKKRECYQTNRNR
jgi:hypothetical protein